MQFREVRFFQPSRPPTLNQYLWRRFVAEETEGKGVQGVSVNPETGRPVPKTALHMQRLKGVTADQIAQDHPEWVLDYRQAHGNGGQK